MTSELQTVQENPEGHSASQFPSSMGLQEAQDVGEPPPDATKEKAPSSGQSRLGGPLPGLGSPSPEPPSEGSSVVQNVMATKKEFLAVHPDGVRVASGQMAGVDKDGKQIGLGSFERGVGSLAFSTADEGTYLCVIDESNEHMLSVWDCVRGTKQAEIKSTNESVLMVEFNPQDSSNIITAGKSHVYFWTWVGSSLTKKQGIFGISKQTHAHEGSIFCLCLCRDGSVLSGGGKDRRLVQWSPLLTVLREVE
ncbi:hypothetical protein E2320_013955, partial [Naja naja]